MRKIAVITSHVYEPMCGLMQKGINKAACELGVKVIYFAGFSDSYSYRTYGEYTRYDEGDNVAYDIPDLNGFDGVIKVSTYFSELAKEHLKDLLSKVKVPVINIGGRDDNHRSIYCDESRSFGEIVEHIISRHGCSDIYHLAGLPEKNFTAERVDAYKSILLSHDIPFDETKVYYGTLWRDCGEAALEYILGRCAKDGKKYPDAVVCANDYSAIGLINACKARGINIPEDMLVTGYDGVDEAVNGYPSVTTSSQPFYSAGYNAVVSILELAEGKKLPDKIRIMGEMKCNQSCGCKPYTADNIEDIRDIYLKRLKNTTKIAQSTTNLMLSVSGADTFEDCFKAVAQNARSNTGFKEMLMCLAPGWDKQRIVGEDYGQIDEEMTVVAGFRGERDIPVQTFRKKDILPKELLEDPYPYYIYTIHHLQYYMGYLIVSPDIDNREQEAQQSWLVDLGMILEDQRIRRDLQLSVKRLEFLSNRDMLTGIYNRRGVEHYYGKFYDECLISGKGLALMIFDMDDLKKINDTYGHGEGDYCIKTIADAMDETAGADEVCTRSGGDEFIVLARNCTKERVDSYIRTVRAVISEKVSKDNKEYSLAISAGAHLGFPQNEDYKDFHKALEDYQRLADAAMYKDKRLHKSGGL